MLSFKQLWPIKLEKFCFHNPLYAASIVFQQGIVLNDLKKLSHLIRLCFTHRVLKVEDLRNTVARVNGLAALPALPAKPEGLRRTAEVFEPRPLGYASGARPSLRSVLRGDRRGEGVSLSHTVPQPVYEPIRPTHNGRPWRPVLCYCCNAPAVYRETFASRDREGRTRMRGVCSA